MCIFQFTIAAYGRLTKHRTWWQTITNVLRYLLRLLIFIPAVAFADRVTSDQQVLYTFDGGSGSVVLDVGGVGAPLDLTIRDAAAASWVPGGLVVHGPTLIDSAGAATKVIDAIRNSNELTVEAWVIPANVTQSGPAQIVTLSGDTDNRNFSLGQGLSGASPTDVFDMRLRSTSTNDNGLPSLNTPAGTASTSLIHVVYTRKASGKAHFYLNGVRQSSKNVRGKLTNWDTGFGLALANEMTLDRPWLGEFRLVAIYSRALNHTEVSQNYAAGDVVTDTEDWRVLSWNIYAGSKTDPKWDMEQLAQSIAQYNPDVICLQEVVQNSSYTDFMDMPALLSDALGGIEYYYDGTPFQNNNGSFGNLILSRHALSDGEKLVYSLAPGGQQGLQVQQRQALKARLTKENGASITAVCAHLATGAQTTNPEGSPGEISRVSQVNEINDWVNTFSDPVVIAGDFNFTMLDEETPTASKALAESYWVNSFIASPPASIPGGSMVPTINPESIGRDYVFLKPVNPGRFVCTESFIADDRWILSDHNTIYSDVRYVK